MIHLGNLGEGFYLFQNKKLRKQNLQWQDRNYFIALGGLCALMQVLTKKNIFSPIHSLDS
jgi:hypothetical protein